LPESDQQRPVALITGASSGIGTVFARNLAARGYDLILLARREDRLLALASELPVKAETLLADLSTEEGIAAAERVIRESTRLELLVNNAGFGTLGRFWEAPVEGQQRMYEVHIIATMRLTHAALAAMVSRGRGGVITVSSVAAFGQSVGNVSYCSTKAWINSFTEASDDADGCREDSQMALAGCRRSCGCLALRLRSRRCHRRAGLEI
jgi:short-subunit dehydrogenase